MFCMGWFWFWILITRSHSISQIGLELIVICLSSASVELQAWAAMPGLKEVFVSIYWLSLWHFYTHAHASARNHWSLSPLSPSESPHSQLVPFLRWRLLWGKPQFSFLTFIPPCAPRFLSGMLSSIWRTFSILPLWCSLKGATSLSFWKVSLRGGDFLEGFCHLIQDSRLIVWVFVFTDVVWGSLACFWITPKSWMIK